MNLSAPSLLKENMNELLESGELYEAAKLAAEIVAIEPQNPNALNVMGSAAYDRRDFATARGAFEKVVALCPESAIAWNNLARTHVFLHEGLAAKNCVERAISINPLILDFYQTLLHCQSLGSMADESMLMLAEKQIINSRHQISKPEQFFSTVSKIYRSSNRIFQARDTLTRGVTCLPDNLDLRFELGNVLFSAGEISAAETEFRTLISARADFALGWQGLAMCQQQKNQLSEAVNSYLRALELDPSVEGVHQNLATLCALAKEWKLAIKHAYQAALQKKDPTATLLQVDSYKRQICDWSCEKDRDLLVSALHRYEGRDASPFLAMPLIDSPALQLKLAQQWHPPRELSHDLSPMGKAEKGRLRVGWFSNDFYDHATMFLIAGLFREYDTERFEFYIYDYGEERESSYRALLTRACANYEDIHNVETDAVVDLVRQHDLDIAIDLKGYTRGSRIDLFEHRLSPIQISFLGYPGTSGNPAFDYMIADEITVPRKFREFYSEAIMYMPDCYQPNDNQRQISEKQFSRNELGLPEGRFVFACFNQVYKVGVAEFSIWMRLLRDLEGSVLWLYVDDKDARSALKRSAEAEGVEPHRIIFASSLPNSEHLSRCRLADLFLDCFNVNAHTSASDVLWAGVPMVTKQGSQFAARVCSSILTSAGLSDFVATSDDEYFEKARQYALDVNWREKTLAHLAQAKTNSALFNTKKYTRDFESLLSLAHTTYKNKNCPEDLYL